MKKHPVYLVLLPLFFTLYHYNQLFGFLSLSHTAFTFLLVLAAAAILFFLSYLFTRSMLKAGIITFFSLLFVLYFGPYHDFIKSISNTGAISRYKIIIPVTAAVLVAVSWFVLKEKPASLKLSGYLNVLFLVLCIVELGRIGINSYSVSKDHNLLYPSKPICDSYTSCNLPDSGKPDIYLLVFDEYTDNNTLKKIWNFDNSDITSYLLQQGFYIPKSSIANYDFTPFSLSSMFNMNYLDKKTGNRGDIAINRLKGVKSMSDNETICLLKKEQYNIRFIAPFENTIEEAGIGHTFESFPEKYIYGLTLPGRLQADIGWNFKKQEQAALEQAQEKNFSNKKRDVLSTIDAIKSTTDSLANRKPKFVYGHFMITHQPHYFDSAGNQLPLNIPGRNNLFKTYTQQVQYANKVIKELCDHIQQYNKKNTIILIQSDHGFREFRDGQAALRYPNFFAMYFPGGNYSKLTNNISLVNEFRIVFNHFFCQQLPLLKDSTIFVHL